MSSFCTTCGAANDGGARFCVMCGTPFPQQQPPQVPQPQVSGQQYTPPAQPVPQQYAPPAQPAPQQYEPPAQPVPQQYEPPAQPVPQQYAPPAQPVPQQYAPPAQPVPQQAAYFTPGQAAQPMQPVQSIQQQGASFVDMHTVLMQAPGALNVPGRPWYVTVEGASIVARWNWMDATFFAPHELTDETRRYTFTVTLSENGKWKEIDVTENKSSGVKMGGGSIGFGSSSNSFKGKTSQKSFSLGMGQNNRTGQAGLIGFKFDTASVKQPIRDYLTSQGWKKSGMFG